jgi:hypothetical protein
MVARSQGNPRRVGVCGPGRNDAIEPDHRTVLRGSSGPIALTKGDAMKRLVALMLVLGLAVCIGCGQKAEKKSGSSGKAMTPPPGAGAKAKAPETKAPETTAPEGKAPEAKAPEAKAPEAKAPEAKGGDTPPLPPAPPEKKDAK